MISLDSASDQSPVFWYISSSGQQWESWGLSDVRETFKVTVWEGFHSPLYFNINNQYEQKLEFFINDAIVNLMSDHQTITWPFPDFYLALISSSKLKKSCLVVGGGGPTHYNPYLRV